MVELIEASVSHGVELHWVDNAVTTSPSSPDGMRKRNAEAGARIRQEGGNMPQSVLLIGAAYTEKHKLDDGTSDTTIQHYAGIDAERVMDLSRKVP